MKDIGKSYDVTPKARQEPSPGKVGNMGKVPGQTWTKQLDSPAGGTGEK